MKLGNTFNAGLMFGVTSTEGQCTLRLQQQELRVDMPIEPLSYLVSLNMRSKFDFEGFTGPQHLKTVPLNHYPIKDCSRCRHTV